jgi:hypothetical protein
VSTGTAGVYGGEVCGDYYMSGSNRVAVDNDCSGGANCKDSRCWGGYSLRTSSSTLVPPWKQYLSENGGLCCQSASQCKSFLDKDGFDEGSACTGNVCDCVPVTTPRTLTMPSTGSLTVRTCVPSVVDLNNELDRSFNIDDVEGRYIRVSAMSIDGVDSGCGTAEKPNNVVTLVFDDSSEISPTDKSGLRLSKSNKFKLSNSALKDCLVNFTIS